MSTTYLCKSCQSDISHKPSNRRVFCNHQCHVAYQRKYPGRVREFRSCKACGCEFETVKSDAKIFCSSSCSAKFNNRNRKQTAETKEKIKKAYSNGKLTGLAKGVALGRENLKNWSLIHRRPAKPLLSKICPICSNEFQTTSWKNKTYCSSSCARSRPGQGGYRPGSVRNYKSGWYESPIAGTVWLDSSYEFIMAEYMDGKGYQWKKNTQGFPYVKADGTGALYVPDFYIQDLDLWVETKGYMTENDKRKLAAFPHKIRLIGKTVIYDNTQWGF